MAKEKNETKEAAVVETVVEEKKPVENSATIPISMTLMVFSVIKS